MGMHNNQGQNYIFTAFLTVAMIIVALLVLTVIPSFKIGERLIKRINIMSDVYEIKDDYLDKALIEEDLELLAQADSVLLSLEVQALEQAAEQAAEQSGQETGGEQVDGEQSQRDVARVEQASSHTVNSEPWQIEGGAATAANSRVEINRPLVDSRVVVSNIDLDQMGEIVKIEDFGAEKSAMADFREALTQRGANRPLRIAVLGDSFIENDIITADLRENFQGALGGNGVGFVAFATPIAKYRQTIKHTFSDWECYSIMTPKKTPEEYQDKFYVSGLVCVPSEGARVTMESTTYRKYTQQSSVARLLFINEKATQMTVKINDSLERVFTPKPSSNVQEIVIRGNIEKLDMTLSNVDGFIGYGVVFEDNSGVSVDNYSVRGTSGMTLFKTSSKINQQMDKILGYDLVILEFGLNIMQAEVLKYDSFSNSLSRIIRYVRSCFPNASVMVMGVGDRGHAKDGKVETMQAVYGVLEAQRAAAENEGAAFWSTFEAMGGHNSILAFVERKWAAKDHLHIGYGGGRYIASQMFRSLMDFDVEETGQEAAQNLEPEAQAEITPVRLDSLEVVQKDSVAVDTMMVDTTGLEAIDIDKIDLDSLGVAWGIENSPEEEPREQKSVETLDSIEIEVILDTLNNM